MRSETAYQIRQKQASSLICAPLRHLRKKFFASIKKLRKTAPNEQIFLLKSSHDLCYEHVYTFVSLNGSRAAEPTRQRRLGTQEAADYRCAPTTFILHPSIFAHNFAAAPH